MAATDNEDDLAHFSDFGAQSVDLGAAGVQIYSTDPTNCPHGYEFSSGTSMAAPHVTGVVALVRTLYPQMPWQGVRYKVLFTVRPPIAIPNPLTGRTVTGGIVDAAAALDCNFNGVLDDQDIANQSSEDCNDNYIPDECEPDEDCNNNTIRDMCDIGAGTSPDCNGNAVPDECDLASGDSDDCNSNNVADECEGSSPVAGACCRDDGTCRETAELCCNLPGEAFAVDSIQCVLIAEGHRACCLGNGSCTVLSEQCCAALGGAFQGGNNETCPGSEGACCPQPFGRCFDTYEDCCNAQGGLFHPGSSCQPRFGCPGTNGPSQAA